MNRVFTLPSGRKIQLQDIDLETLTELHGMKLITLGSLPRFPTGASGNTGSKPDVAIYNGPAFRRELFRTSTPAMRRLVAETPEDFYAEASTEPYVIGLSLDLSDVEDVADPCVQARIAVLNHILEPGVRVTGTLAVDPMPEFVRDLLSRAAFDTNKVEHPTVTLGNALDSFNRKAGKLKIRNKPDKNRVFTCGDLVDTLKRLSSEHEYQHSNHVSEQPLTKHYML
jgi:hypothetical protein